MNATEEHGNNKRGAALAHPLDRPQIAPAPARAVSRSKLKKPGGERWGPSSACKLKKVNSTAQRGRRRQENHHDCHIHHNRWRHHASHVTRHTSHLLVVEVREIEHAGASAQANESEGGTQGQRLKCQVITPSLPLACHECLCVVGDGLQIPRFCASPSSAASCRVTARGMKDSRHECRQR